MAAAEPWGTDSALVTAVEVSATRMHTAKTTELRAVDVIFFFKELREVRVAPRDSSGA